MLSRALAVAVCAAVFAVVPATGQQPAPGQVPTFRTSIDAVTVDVIVTDRQGRPVLDLKQDDFEIVEAKKPQAIQTFKLIKIEDAPEQQSSFTREISSLDDMRREAARDDSRLLLIFLDDYHVRIGNSLSIKPMLASFINQLTPRDLVAVMYPLTDINAITFSRNHDAVAAAVMGFLGRKYNYTPTNPYEWRYADYPPEALEILRRQIVFSALRSAAMFLGTLREGKKEILYVSEGLNGTLPTGAKLRGTSPMREEPARLGASQQFFNQVEVLDEMHLLFTAAARTNTAIYTLDPRGLAVTDSQINENTSLAEDHIILNEAQDSLKIMASNTDGRAIVNQNNPIPALKKMIADMSGYYLLGYTSTEAPRDGKFHEIQVRVKRKDVDVRFRKGYWAYTAEDAARATTPAEPGPTAAVEEALATLVESREHLMRYWVGSERGADGKAAVTFAWEPVPSRAPVSGRGFDEREVMDRLVLEAASIQGDMLFRGPVPRDTQAATVAGRVTFSAPPGTVQLKLVAENSRGTRLDHDETMVEVPDFTTVGPLITTPLVFRARTAREIQLIKAADAPVPAVGRQFSRTERLLVRFQAYGPAGTTPAITLRLLNSRGKSMSDLPAPARLPDGRFETEIGLGSLAPGDYLIEINAKTDSDSTQSMLAIRIAS